MAVHIAESLAQAIVLAALLWASVTDLRQRVIPNACVTTVVAAFILRAVAAPGSQGAAHCLATGFAHACLIFSLLLLSVAFMSRLGCKDSIGAGDLKLFSALATTTAPMGSLQLIGLSCTIGLAAKGVAAAAASARRRAVSWGGAAPAALRWGPSAAPAPAAEGIPMAPAIAVSWVVVQILSACIL